MILNGVIGAELHVSFPVVARASFGFNFSKFAVVIRLITALFWHGMLFRPTMWSALTLSSNPNIYRLDRNNPGYSSNLAVVLGHSKSHPCLSKELHSSSYALSSVFLLTERTFQLPALLSSKKHRANSFLGWDHHTEDDLALFVLDHTVSSTAYSPYKLKWFFVFKSVVVIVAALGTVIGLAVQAGGAGNIWQQKATVSGSTKAWLVLSSMSSITGGW